MLNVLRWFAIRCFAFVFFDWDPNISTCSVCCVGLRSRRPLPGGRLLTPADFSPLQITPLPPLQKPSTIIGNLRDCSRNTRCSRTRGRVPIWNFRKQVLDNTPGMQHNTPSGCRCIAQGCTLSRGCTRISLQKTSLMPLGPRQAAQKQTWKKLEIWKIYLCQISYIQGTWKREIPV